MNAELVTRGSNAKKVRLKELTSDILGLPNLKQNILKLCCLTTISSITSLQDVYRPERQKPKVGNLVSAGFCESYLEAWDPPEQK